MTKEEKKVLDELKKKGFRLKHGYKLVKRKPRKAKKAKPVRKKTAGVKRKTKSKGKSKSKQLSMFKRRLPA